MALLLSESEVKSILTMPLALEAVENSFHRLADGSALLHPRARLHLPRQKLPPLHGRRRFHQRLHGTENLHQLQRRPALPDSAVQRRVRRSGGPNRSRLCRPDAHRRRQRRRHQTPRARQRQNRRHYRHRPAGAHSTGSHLPRQKNRKRSRLQPRSSKGAKNSPPK